MAYVTIRFAARPAICRTSTEWRTDRMPVEARSFEWLAERRQAGSRLAGKCVCIVDNLVATGATVCEVSKALRRAGARRVYAAVIGRTVFAGDVQALSVEAVV